MGADAASAFLIGRLAQRGLTPDAVLRASTSGPLRGVAGVHVFAVADGQLWLAQPRLLGDPSLASVPLTDVQGARLLPGPKLELRLNGRPMRWTVLDDGAAAERFVAAVGALGPPER